MVSLPLGTMSLINATAWIPSNIFAVTPASQVSDSNSDGIMDTATLNYTSMVNQPELFPHNDHIIFVFVTLVTNNVANMAGSLITSDCHFTYMTGSYSLNSASVTIVEPVLVWNMSYNITSGQSGDAITYTVIVQHGPTSTADAFNIKISPLLDSAVQLITHSITASDATALIAPSLATLLAVSHLGLLDSLSCSFQVCLSFPLSICALLTLFPGVVD